MKISFFFFHYTANSLHKFKACIPQFEFLAINILFKSKASTQQYTIQYIHVFSSFMWKKIKYNLYSEI